MKTLKLIVEDASKFRDNCIVTLVEGDMKDEQGNRRMPKIKGPFIETEAVNRNGRIYPIDLMKPVIEQYVTDRIIPGKYRSYGELGHPEGVEINLHRWSHYITALEWADNLVIGEAQLVDTEYGRIAETVLKNGMEMGVSSRGLGALDEARLYERNGMEGQLVTDYEMVAVDIVADPSAPKGFVEGIMEGKEYIISGGNYTECSLRKSEKAYSNLSEGLSTLPKKDVDDHLLNSLNNFFKDLKIS
jgi:hypothetical protein